MFKIFRGGEWVEGTPTDGELVREIQGSGSYVEYRYITPTPKAPDMRITKLAFKQRMTAAERIAIRSAAETDPVVLDFMDLVSDAQYIDLSRSDTQTAVGYLEQQGHLASGRANEILTDPIQDEERP